MKGTCQASARQQPLEHDVEPCKIERLAAVEHDSDGLLAGLEELLELLLNEPGRGAGAAAALEAELDGVTAQPVAPHLKDAQLKQLQ